MGLPILSTKALTAGSKLLYKIGRKKPEICVVGGVILGGTAVIFAVKDTWDNKAKLQSDFREVKALKEKTVDPIPEMTYEERLTKARKKLWADILKTYYRTAIFSVGSTILVVLPVRMLRHELMELGAAYAMMAKTFQQYRENVVADQGAEKDQEYMYGLKAVEGTDPNGNPVKSYEQIGNNLNSRRSVWFDEGVWDDDNGRWIWKNPLWSDHKETMASNLKGIQNSENSSLRIRGFRYENEVRQAMCLPMVEDGWEWGWVKGGLIEDNGVDRGGTFIDFGIFDDYADGLLQLPVNKAFLDSNSNQKIPLIVFNSIPIKGIYKDIFEYDNRSTISYDKRKAIPCNDPAERYEKSKEHLDRWFAHEENYEND